ncbi:hypothetical protein [Nevskia ramosa]|uniref:hypothetical protein n=1 Tax=Nevskia ramosa TaxID=64002 RepID=UPI002352444E|nr:hypothetical protein [Nevskia ramosa]
MNTSTFFRRSTLVAAALASFALSQPAAAAGGVSVAAGDVNGDGVHYVGRDGNWFNPSNWSSRRVPGAGDNVFLDGQDYVVIDPKNDPTGYSKVTFGDLVISSVAVLETLPGARIENRDTHVFDAGQFIHRSSSQGGTLVIGGRSATMNVGLGGTTPASLMRDAAGGNQLAAGPGHYSTMTADTMDIEGELKLSIYYGFEPRPGDSYQIITINGTRSGEFIGLPEGGYVGCTDQNVGMRISYVGGDGNDIVISAEQTEPGICLLLPAVQKVREAASRSREAALDPIDNVGGAAAGLAPPSVQKEREATVSPLIKTPFKWGTKPAQPLPHDCEGTQCSCFGDGCKGFAAVCKADTLECGLYQCVCEKK